MLIQPAKGAATAPPMSCDVLVVGGTVAARAVGEPRARISASPRFESEYKVHANPLTFSSPST